MSTSRVPILLTIEKGIEISSGLKHCAILTRKGNVLTAGDSASGQLGRPLTDNAQEFKIGRAKWYVNLRGHD